MSINYSDLNVYLAVIHAIVGNKIQVRIPSLLGGTVISIDPPEGIFDVPIGATKLVAANKDRTEFYWVVAGDIAANSITAGLIAAGTITGDLIAADSITARELAVTTQGANLLANWSFEDPNFDQSFQHVVVGNPTTNASVMTSSTAPSTKVLQLTVAGNAWGFRAVPVTPLAKYHVKVYVRTDIGSTGNGLGVRMLWKTNATATGFVRDGLDVGDEFDGLTYLLGAANKATYANTWTPLTYTWTAPAGARWATLAFSNELGTGNAYFDHAVIQEQFGSTFISDGAIVTGKLSATAVQSTNYVWDNVSTFTTTGTLLSLDDGSMRTPGMFVNGVSGAVTVRGALTATAINIQDPSNAARTVMSAATSTVTDPVVLGSYSATQLQMSAYVTPGSRVNPRLAWSTAATDLSVVSLEGAHLGFTGSVPPSLKYIVQEGTSQTSSTILTTGNPRGVSGGFQPPESRVYLAAIGPDNSFATRQATATLQSSSYNSSADVTTFATTGGSWIELSGGSILLDAPTRISTVGGVMSGLSSFAPFRIGNTSAATLPNLQLDSNKIQAANNNGGSATAATLYLQPYGGNLRFNDDVELTESGVANAWKLQGVQTPANAMIYFGSGSTSIFGANGNAAYVTAGSFSVNATTYLGGNLHMGTSSVLSANGSKGINFLDGSNYWYLWNNTASGAGYLQADVMYFRNAAASVKLQIDSEVKITASARMNDNYIYLRGGSDTNHSVKWDNLVIDGFARDGIWLRGYDNVVLGITSNGKTCFFSSNGNMYLAPGGTYTNHSSREKKHDIESIDIDDALAEVAQWRPVTFVYNEDDLDRVQDGFIAEEMHPVTPNMVQGVDDPDYPIVMDYGKATPRLAGAVQALLARIETLEARLEAAGL